MTRPVRVQITIVSIKGSRIATIPSEHGSFVRAAACAIGAEPAPASLLNNPLFTPLVNAKENPAPKKPPKADVPVNTFANY